MAKQEIVYLKHPVTAEQKADARSKGLKILDAKFAPKEVEKPKKATKPKKQLAKK